jgi:hypothetical protein
MQWIFATFLELLLGSLESVFKRDPRFAKSNGGDNDDDFYSNNPNAPGDNGSSHENRLNEAYKFMELTRPVTQAELKKRYKKLSLKYHPDRNQGSEESHAQMTKLNACFDLMEQDLEGPVVEEEKEVAPENSGDENHGDGQQPPPPRDGNDMRKQYEKMRKEMQREMQEELARCNKLKEDFQTNKRLNQKECREKAQAVGLDTKEGRQAAHESFRRQVKKETEPESSQGGDSSSNSSSTAGAEKKPTTNMHDIDDHSSSPEDSNNKTTKEPQQQAETETCSSTAAEEKPKNLIMEYNTDDVIVALRMGMTEIGMELLQEELQNFAKERTLDARFTGETLSAKDLRYEFLSRSLDDDQNALMHYAIYYEDYEMIRALCQMALREQFLDKILYQANVHGETPLVFAKIAKEGRILVLVQAQITLAEQMLARTQAWPALKHAGQRLWGLVRHVDLVTTASTCLSFYIGYAEFQLYTIITFLGILGMQLLVAPTELGPKDVRGVPDVTMLLIYYGVCKAIVIFFRLVRPYIMWELVLVMTPITMAGCCSSKQKIIQRFSYLPIRFLRGARFLIHGVTWVVGKLTPKMLVERGFVKPLLLCISLGLSKGIRQGLVG